YNGLNGATNEGNPTTYTIESDSIELSAPGSRTGYTFDGWYADSSYTTPVTGIVSGSTGSRTFWAKWVANTYTVTYNTSGGNTIASLAVTYNATYNLATPTKQHYVFVTWTYNGNSFPQNGTWTIDSDITVVAEYTPVVYTITYQLPLDQSHENSETFTVEDNFNLLPATAPLGYEFDGWYRQQIGGTKVTNTSSLNGHTTLYARY